MSFQTGSKGASTGGVFLSGCCEKVFLSCMFHLTHRRTWMSASMIVCRGEAKAMTTKQ